MRKIKEIFNGITCLCTIAVVVLIVLVSVGTVEIGLKEKPEEVIEIINEDEKKSVISRYEVNEKLSSIQELATYEFAYTGRDVLSDKRDFAGLDNIWGTEKSIDVTYGGIIKMGYDMEQVSYRIDNETMKIIVTLPTPSVLDNYVILDSLVLIEHNNLLNPIKAEDLKDVLVHIEKAELTRAKNSGLELKAEEHMKSIIDNYLAEFTDYAVEYA